MSRFRALAPIYLSVFLFVAGNSALTILIPVHLAENGHLSTAAIGFVVSAFGLSSLAARLPAGLMYTAGRGNAFLVAGALLNAAAYALLPVAQGTATFALLMALNGIGWSIATTAQLALLVARPPGGVGTAAAMGWFSGATGLGNMAAGVLGGFIADRIGLDATFYVLAITPVIGALLMVRTSRVLARPARTRPAPRSWRLLGEMPLALWAGVLVMFFINGLNALQNTFYPVLATAAGLSLTQIGAASSLRSWASSSSRFGSGPLFQRFDPAGLTLPLVVLGTLATCAIPSVIDSFLLQIPLFLFTGLSRGLLRVTGSADAFDAVGADDRAHGLTSALLYGGLDLGKIVLPLVGGVVAHAFGIATMLRVVPLALLLLYLALALPARRRATMSAV